MKKCIKCGARLSQNMEACTECREMQPLPKTLKLVAGLVAAFLAWLAFH